MNKQTKIIVTGVKGQLGFECVEELLRRGYTNVLGIDKDELDLTNENAVKSFFRKEKPNVIMHNAAWTQVDKAEEQKDLVYKINSLAPKYLAEASKKLNAKIVYISTDYVFNGKGDKPFEVSDKKDGLSIYGLSKSKGEDFIKESTDKYFIVRTSWVFGKNGHNFVETMLNLADSGLKEIKVVDEQIGSPTYARDLAVLLCDMIETDKYGIYHATNEGFTSWAEFAKTIFDFTSKETKVVGVSTDEYKKINPNQASRPLNSRLSKKSLDDNGFKRLPLWQDALKRYLKEKGE